MSTVLEQLQTTGFKVVVRDTQTGKTRTLRLVGQGPWDLDADTAIDIDGEAGPRPQVTVAPPPDAAITFRIACTREDTSVRIGATGSGAKAWTAHQRTLLGASWQLDAQGAPFVLLDEDADVAGRPARGPPRRHHRHRRLPGHRPALLRPHGARHRRASQCSVARVGGARSRRPRLRPPPPHRRRAAGRRSRRPARAPPRSASVASARRPPPAPAS
jgi:hypothetical protein